MKILLLGGTGQVGQEIIQLAQEKKLTLFSPNRDECDITNFAALDKTFQKIEPDYVINAAAFTQVDLAEKEYEQAFAINATAARYLAILAAENHCALIHLSTDYVFDGKKKTAYDEEDEPHPINAYGKTKFEGEEAIQFNSEKYIILRVSSVFGAHGNNFVKTILRLAKEKEELNVVHDQYSSPTPAADIAEVVLSLCVSAATDWGIYHYSGKPSLSWYEFAEKIISIAQHSQLKDLLKVKKIIPIASKDFKALAERPKNSVLNCNKIKKVFNIKQPFWEDGLKNVIQTL